MTILTAEEAKQARASLGLSQAHVAKEIEIDRPTLSHFERSVVFLNDEAATRLRNYYLSEGQKLAVEPPAVAALRQEPKVTTEDLPDVDESGNRFVHGVRVSDDVSDERAAVLGFELDEIAEGIDSVLGEPIEQDGWSVFAAPGEDSKGLQNRLRLLMARGYCAMLELQGLDATSPCTLPVAGFGEGGASRDQQGWLAQAFGDLSGFIDPAEDPDAPTERTDLNWMGLGRSRERENLGRLSDEESTDDGWLL